MGQPKYEPEVNVRAWREHRRLSLDDLVAKSGVSKSQIGAIERGDRGYTRDSLERIADALEIPPAIMLYIHPDEVTILDLLQGLDREKREMVRSTVKGLVGHLRPPPDPHST